MAPRQNRVWQPREDRVLTLRWGATSLASIAKRLGRSVGAIVHRGHDLGLKLSRHGLTSRTGLATRSGYDIRSINAAIRVLGLAPSKLPSGGAFSGTGHASRVGLDDDQVDAVLAYLGKRGERREHHRPEGTGHKGRWGVLDRAAQLGPVTFAHLPDGDVEVRVAGRVGRGPGWEEALAGALSATNGGACG